MGPILRLYKKKNGTISLEFSIWYRILSGFITSVFGIVIFAYNAHTVFAYILFLGSLFSFLFDERWTFDPNKETVSNRIGFFFLGKKKTFSFDEVEAIELSIFYKGLSELHKETKAQKEQVSDSMDRVDDAQESTNGMFNVFSKFKNPLKRKASAQQRLSLIFKKHDPLVIDIRKFQEDGTLQMFASTIAEECNFKYLAH